ncbi:MAG: mercury(II) reductase [Acidobacteria bacterium]|nr:mercury(II) reductase [Acidobacteriota bacterium]
MTKPIELSISGMHCDHCEITVGGALERAGLSNVEVDWRRGQAGGTAGADFSTDRAAEEVAQIGYTLVSDDASATSTSGRQDIDDGSDYDLVIIGSGSAAFAAAIKGRELGAQVAVVEQGTVGGTCVNTGCVPSKALLRAGEAYWNAGHHPFAGVETRTGGVNLKALVDQKAELVAQLRTDKYEDLIDHYEFDLIRGTARFTRPDTVEVAGRTLHANRFLIATGASPWIPPIDGIEDTGYLTSTQALELTDIPAKLIVIGANAIGLELGQLFLHLGSQVTWVEALDRIAPFEEPEISAELHSLLEAQGAIIHTSATVSKAVRDGDHSTLHVDSNGEQIILHADQLLVATGRRANTNGLNLEAAGVDTDERGRIIVNDQLNTSNPAIYAAGDVTNHPQFVYVAALGGNIAAENALRHTTRTIDFTTMPRVTFTAPNIASVGVTEQQAKDKGRSIITSVLPLDVVPRALVDHETNGLIKLVADEADGKLLGAHILAHGAGDVIQAAVMALKYHATVDEIADTYHPYLTMAEGLKLAAQGFDKDVKTLSCCAA